MMCGDWYQSLIGVWRAVSSVEKTVDSQTVRELVLGYGPQVWRTRPS